MNQIEKIVEDYERGKQSIVKAKEKYKSLKTVLNSEEFQIKQKREEIEVLQQELHSLRTRQEMIENNVSKVANDVNEYIFLL